MERTPKKRSAIGNPCVKPLQERQSPNPFGTANPAFAAPAPSGWNAQKALAYLFPAVDELRRAIEPEIRAIAARLDRAEARGCDTSRFRQILGELRWRLEYTADEPGIRLTIERLRSLSSLPASVPGVVTPAGGGSYGGSTDVWFLKLDASVDDMLTPDFDDRRYSPHFLDRINDPAA